MTETVHCAKRNVFRFFLKAEALSAFFKVHYKNTNNILKHMALVLITHQLLVHLVHLMAGGKKGEVGCQFWNVTNLWRALF